MNDAISELIERARVLEEIARTELRLRMITMNELRAMCDALEFVAQDQPEYQEVVAHVNATLQRLDTYK